MKKLSLQEIEIKINNIYFIAKIRSYTGKNLTDVLNTQVFNELNTRTKSGRKRYTTYEIAYAKGYNKAKFNFLMSELVEFCYIVNGVMYSTYKKSSHNKTEELYKENKGYLLGESPHAFFWIGTDKPFTELTTI